MVGLDFFYIVWYIARIKAENSARRGVERLLDNLRKVNRYGKPYYGAAALMSQIFGSKNDLPDDFDRKAELEKYENMIRDLGYKTVDQL